MPPQREPKIPFAPTPAHEITVGTSAKGTPIQLYVFGPEGSGRERAAVTLVIAAIHGDESPAAVVGQRLLEHLRDHPDATAGNTVGVIPVANPDGVAAHTRTNANVVDVNRNFPASNWRATRPGRNSNGPAAASEPETRAVMQAMAMLRPTRVVSIHSPLRCNNYDGPPAAQALAQLMAGQNGYPVQATIGYATPGSFGTWAGVDQGVPVVTLELAPHMTGERAWQENREALLAVIAAPR